MSVSDIPADKHFWSQSCVGLDELSSIGMLKTLFLFGLDFNLFLYGRLGAHCIEFYIGCNYLMLDIQPIQNTKCFDIWW